MPLPQDKKEPIYGIFESFLQNQVRAIQRLRIEDLNINPFLMRLRLPGDLRSRRPGRCELSWPGRTDPFPDMGKQNQRFLRRVPTTIWG